MVCATIYIYMLNEGFDRILNKIGLKKMERSLHANAKLSKNLKIIVFKPIIMHAHIWSSSSL